MFGRALIFVSNSESKLAEYRTLLGLPNLLREPMVKAESATDNLVTLVREKCEQTMAYVDPPFFVEHTALEISALNGWPGALTEPFLSKNSNAKLLKMIDACAGTERNAVAKIAIGFLPERGAKVRVIEGATRGQIAQESRGAGGFGWDPIFIPEGEIRTYAEMSVEEKSRTSMRAKAAAALKILLQEAKQDKGTVVGLSSLETSKLDAAIRPIRVFVSYSHQDSKHFRNGGLLDYISGLSAEGFKFWYDRNLAAGDVWDDEIRNELAAADIALVLVSQSLLNSRYCIDVEVATFIQRRAKLGLVIFPVILSPCDWKAHAWLASTQFEPRDGKTISRNYRDKGAREELYLNILEQLRRVGKSIRGGLQELPSEK